MWNQHLCYHTFSWDQHFAVSEVKSAVTHSFEINSSFLKWNQHLCSQAFSWNPYFTLFKLNQHLCSHAFSWNQHFTVFEVKSTPLRSHILNIFELMHWQEINVSLFLKRNQHLNLTCWCEINISLFFKWKQHLWGVTWITGQVLRSTSHMIICTQQIIIFGSPEQI